VTTTLNGMALPPSQVEVGSYRSDKTVFSLLVKIAPGNRAEVKIAYLSPWAFTAKTSAYQFFFQKQPGDKTAPLILSLETAANFLFSPLNFLSTSGSKEKIFYSSDTSVDRIFAFSLKTKN